MAILVLQHSDSGHPGRLGATLRDHGFRLDIRRPDVGGHGNGIPPDLDNIHGVVIMGGPMNVTEIGELPWMQEEAAFIKKAHEARLPLVGVCLGAQLIAHALGGQVAPKPAPEIGFRTLSLNPAGQTEPVLAGIAWDSPQLFSCGQEITQLPPGAVLLGSTRGTKHAVYKAGIRTYGFINHFECDRAGVDTLLRSSADMLARAGVSEGDAKADADKHYSTFARLSDRLCLNLVALVFPLNNRLAG